MLSYLGRKKKKDLINQSWNGLMYDSWRYLMYFIVDRRYKAVSCRTAAGSRTSWQGRRGSEFKGNIDPWSNGERNPRCVSVTENHQAPHVSLNAKFERSFLVKSTSLWSFCKTLGSHVQYSSHPVLGPRLACGHNPIRCIRNDQGNRADIK